MQLAVIHYHYEQGGVTQVVKNHLSSLAAAGDANPIDRAVLIHGGRAAGIADHARGGLPWTETAVAGLDYDDRPEVRPQLADDLAEALDRAGLQRDRDVLHVHNHTLGKNVSLTAAVGELARRGWRQLLQIHDFAEDWRPANYRRLVGAWGSPPAAAYPTASQLQYAALTERDASALRVAGVEAVVLPNPVAAPPKSSDPLAARRRVAGPCGLKPQQRLLVYPVRGIRRKNLGEAALWSAVLRGRVRILQTMPPASPAERPSYRRWKEFAARHDLPLRLGAEGCEFADLIAASDAILTTSVAEGFGMVFLEPWLAERRLLGRDLPGVTADFRRQGVVFQETAERLTVPMSWVGAERFRRELSAAYDQAAEGLDEVTDPGDVERQLEALTDSDEVDFAMLAPNTQAEVVERVLRQPDKLPETTRQLMERALLTADESGAAVADNARAVGERFSPATIGHQLSRLYRSLSRQPCGEVEPAPHGDRLLGQFLRIDRLSPCRLPWARWERDSDG